ncbi:MAG: hypothetical protein AAF267_17990, partial [Deinococcota bacterium]
MSLMVDNILHDQHIRTTQFNFSMDINSTVQGAKNNSGDEGAEFVVREFGMYDIPLNIDDKLQLFKHLQDEDETS